MMHAGVVHLQPSFHTHNMTSMLSPPQACTLLTVEIHLGEPSLEEQ